jgi:MraZ protein
MFWGEYAHQLDKKGRLIIPARYRPHVSQGAVLTRGIDHNLVIYPQEAWRTVCDQLNQLPITHPSGRALRRLLFSGAVELSIDKQGRVLIPAYLRDYATLNGEVLIVGMETFVELWSPAEWQTTLDGLSSVLAENDTFLKLNV